MTEDIKRLVEAAQSAVDLGIAMRAAKLDNEPPARITLSDGTTMTGEVAEAFEAIAEAIIGVADQAKAALAPFTKETDHGED